MSKMRFPRTTVRKRKSKAQKRDFAYTLFVDNTSLDINKINDKLFNDSSAIILSNGLQNELTSFPFVQMKVKLLNLAFDQSSEV